MVCFPQRGEAVGHDDGGGFASWFGGESQFGGGGGDGCGIEARLVGGREAEDAGMGSLAAGFVEDAFEGSVAAGAEEIGEPGGERKGVGWQWFLLFRADFCGFGEDFRGFGEETARGVVFGGEVAEGLSDELGGCDGGFEVIALQEGELFSGGGVGEFLGVVFCSGVIGVKGLEVGDGALPHAEGFGPLAISRVIFCCEGGDTGAEASEIVRAAGGFRLTEGPVERGDLSFQVGDFILAAGFFEGGFAAEEDERSQFLGFVEGVGAGGGD